MCFASLWPWAKIYKKYAIALTSLTPLPSQRTNCLFQNKPFLGAYEESSSSSLIKTHRGIAKYYLFYNGYSKDQGNCAVIILRYSKPRHSGLRVVIQINVKRFVGSKFKIMSITYRCIHIVVYLYKHIRHQVKRCCSKLISFCKNIELIKIGKEVH